MTNQSGTEQSNQSSADAGQTTEEKNQQSQETQGTNNFESKWDDETRAYIQKLRNEAANYRTKSKELASKLSGVEEKEKKLREAMGIEETVDPKEKLMTLTQQTETLNFRNAVLQVALENGISAEDIDYLSYRIEKAAMGLEDDAELSEEELSQIVSDVKGRSNKSTMTSTSVGAGGKKTPSPNASTDINLDQFIAMSMGEKSKLYMQNPDRYKELIAEAKRANRLV